MKIIKIEDLKKKNRVIKCPFGDFVSNRFLLKSDNMGYTITKTIIPKNITSRKWHYQNHLESCYCISGKAKLINLKTLEEFDIKKDTLYALDNHDAHKLVTEKETVLICVFNPPLKGNETHNKEGVYVTKNNEGGINERRI